MNHHVINSDTVLYGVIGQPIKQSKSPIMQNRAFAEHHINANYLAFQIAPEQLAQFVQGARAMGMGGFNVTIPHKLAIMDHLDEIDEDAKALGAVNTVVNRNGRLIGYNTDGIGYVRSLKDEAIADITGKNIVVIGAGGASRGIIHALLKEKPAQIIVANRTVDKAYQLVESLSCPSGTLLKGIALHDVNSVLSEAHIIINTTSIGMYPQVDEMPIDLTPVQAGTVVSDLIYNPLETKFVQEAKAKGCIGHGGLGMFINQGAYAFEYWTGKSAPTEAMKQTVVAAL